MAYFWTHTAYVNLWFVILPSLCALFAHHCAKQSCPLWAKKPLFVPCVRFVFGHLIFLLLQGNLIARSLTLHFFLNFFAKKFAKPNLFIVPLHRISEMTKSQYGHVRDGREMVAFAFGKWIVKGPNHTANWWRRPLPPLFPKIKNYLGALLKNVKLLKC